MISSTPSHSQTYFTISKHIYKLCLFHQPTLYPKEGCIYTKRPLPPYRPTRTVTMSFRFRINLQYAQNGSFLTKIVDPSLETSLKVFISVPTRSFGRPSFTKYCTIRLLNAKAGELSVTYGTSVFKKDAPNDVVTGSIRRDKGLNNS